jgi:hypothetical protein
MPNLKVLLILNACDWASWPTKIQAIKDFYAPLAALDIDIIQTNFANVPLSSYPGTVTTFVNGVATDTNGTDLEIDQTWFNENIGPLIAGYDIAIFQAANVAATGLPLGVKFEQLNGTWCCETFVTDENFTYSLPGTATSAGPSLGNEAEVIIEHEISHALYSISGQTDNTHLYFYANNFARVLTDIVLPNASALTKLYQQLIADLQAELGIIKSQTSTADMNTPPAQPTMPQTTAPSVTDLATFIKGYEGWIAPSPTMPNGSISYQCNNPSNAKFAGQQYAVARIFEIKGVEETFAAFDTYEHGWQYMIDCLTEVVKGTDTVYNEAARKLGLTDCSELTLNQFFTIRDPKGDANTPLVYAAAAAKKFGVGPATFRMKQFTV